MKLISIKWFVTFETTNDLDGKVMITESKNNEILGEWRIGVDEHTISHTPSNPNDNLPPICEDEIIMRKVEQFARVYHSGMKQREQFHVWDER